jgi:hypothetical protein
MAQKLTTLYFCSLSFICFFVSRACTSHNEHIDGMDRNLCDYLTLAGSRRRWLDSFTQQRKECPPGRDCLHLLATITPRPRRKYNLGTKSALLSLYWLNYQDFLVVICGVMVSVPAIGLMVREFKPSRGRWTFKGDKNPQHAFLRREEKPSVHVVRSYSMLQKSPKYERHILKPNS